MYNLIVKSKKYEKFSCIFVIEYFLKKVASEAAHTFFFIRYCFAP